MTIDGFHVGDNTSVQWAMAKPILDQAVPQSFELAMDLFQENHLLVFINLGRIESHLLQVCLDAVIWVSHS